MPDLLLRLSPNEFQNDLKAGTVPLYTVLSTAAVGTLAGINMIITPPMRMPSSLKVDATTVIVRVESVLQKKQLFRE